MRAYLLSCGMGLALALLLAGCFFDEGDQNTYPCSPEWPQCPEGYTCNGTTCVKPGTGDTAVPDAPLDGPSLADQAKPDAPVSDGPVIDGPRPDSTVDVFVQPDVPPPDMPVADTAVKLDLWLPDVFVPDLPPPDTVPPADGACSAGATQSCYTGPTGTKGVGLCQTGTQTCTGGSWSSCSGEVTPETEVCDGDDNDCNGSADDTFTCVKGAPATCITGCGSVGTKTCDSSCSWGSCVPPTEVCNGVDDDCVGGADDGFQCVKSSSGTCTTSCGTIGTRVCNTSCNWGTCTPPAEVCNGQDDDCDGAKDDGFQCTKGVTGNCTTTCGSIGSRTCSASCTWGSCQTPAEVCNGADDDCDGTPDDGFDCVKGSSPVSCTTACGSTGSKACKADCSWDVCVAPSETCNGADDDCDLKIDEDFDCVQNSTGGSCTTSCGSTGTQQCSATCKWDCEAPSETCNGADDDCDGSKDEDYDCVQGETGGTCTTSCGSTGTKTCSSTCKWTCEPPKEVCNLVDDDCDKQVDEGFKLNTYYYDGDGDGKGDPNNTKGACMAPPNYVSNKDDCDDKDKYVFKGQTAYFTSQSLNMGWDYNCSGATEKKYNDAQSCHWDILGNCQGLAQAYCSFNHSSPPACGAFVSVGTCAGGTTCKETCFITSNQGCH